MSLRLSLRNSKKSALALTAAAFVASFGLTSLPAASADTVVAQSKKKKQGSGSGEHRPSTGLEGDDDDKKGSGSGK